MWVAAPDTLVNLFHRNDAEAYESAMGELESPPGVHPARIDLLAA